MNKIKNLNKTAAATLPHLILFATSVFCFASFFSYVFFYQEKSGLFLTSSDYLAAHLNRPGGLLMYFSEFLTAFYFYPLAGAFILSAIITLTAILVQQIQKYYTGNNGFILPYVVGGALFFLQTGYPFGLFNSLGLLVQLLAFYLVLKSGKFLNGWLPVVLFPLWYFVTGSFSLICALQFSLHLTLKDDRQRWLRLIVLWILAFGFLYLGKTILFYFSLKNLLVYPFEAVKPDINHLILFAVLFLVALLPLHTFVKSNFLKNRLTSQFSVSLILIAGAAILVSRQIDRKDRDYFRVEQLFDQENYSGVIDYVQQHPSANLLTSFLTNVALSEQNQLTDKLFLFSQSPDGKTLFLPWEMETELLKRGGYFYYSIGMTNEAQRWAYENMVMKGLTPEGLKMLIKTELINGNHLVAAKYIDILNHTLFYRAEARSFAKLLNKDQAIEANAELSQKRQLQPKADFFALTKEPELNLEAVLKSDSLNRKALEYKAAFLLLKKDIKAVIGLIPLYQTTGAAYLPRYIEEAVVAYKMLHMGDPAAVETVSIRPETINRFGNYIKIFSQYGNHKEAARADLYKNFGDTFWYYIFYR